MVCHQNAVENYGIKIVNKYFENMENLKYVVTLGCLRTHSCVTEYAMSQLNLEHACCHLVENTLSFPSLSKKT